LNNFQPIIMPINDYGVWKATPTKFTAQGADEDPTSPHGHVIFTDGVSSKKLSAAINIKSLSADTRLVYWLLPDFQHPLRQHLEKLPRGWTDIQREDQDLSLDLLRSGVVDVKAGRLLPHDLPGSLNDIIDYLVPFFDAAIRSKATIYLYGEQFRSKDGVHDIHMNQGSDGGFRKYNGIYQDGGIVLEFPDGHWEAFFIAFASQTVKTTNDGHPDGPTFAELLHGTVAPPPVGGDDSTDVDDEPTTATPIVSIQAALVNPDGPDGGENPELVYLISDSASPVYLKGWTIANHLGMSGPLPDDAQLEAVGAKKSFEVVGVPLSNKGGSIILKSADGRVVHQVEYSKEQASRSGQLLYFS
jgi:uncharacterized protein YukJ